MPGDPIQYEVGRAGWSRKIRLSRPEDPDSAGPCGEMLRRRGIDVDLTNLPLDDALTFAMLIRANTAGVFQLESTGMRDVLRKLKPDVFEDIIAAVALYRPGSYGQHPKFHKPETRVGAHRLYAPGARAVLKRNLRDHGLSRAGDAGRASAGRVQPSAAPTFCAAPWAKKSSRRWICSAVRSWTARSPAG